jgi:hypothetical protein
MSALQSWYRRLFSFPVVLAGALMVTLLFLATTVSNGNYIIADPDIWWHLENARHLVTTGHFIRQDVYSFTVHGKPWINFEWLAELPYYFAYRWLGDRGLFLVMIAAVEAIVVGVFTLSYLRSRDVKAAFLASWVAVLLMPVSLGPRTLLFGWLLLVIELGILWLYREGRDYTWLLPPLFLVWINTHGSWFIGFVLMLIFFGSGLIAGTWGSVESPPWTPAQRTRLLIVTGLSFIALFVNPYGWHLVAYPLDVAFRQSQTLKYVAEWATLDFHGLRGKFVLVVLFLLAVANLVRRRTWLLSDLLFALIVIYGAVTYSRFVFLAGIVLSPLLAIDFRGVLVKYDRNLDRLAPNAIALAVLAALAAILNPSAAALHQGVSTIYPEQALARLRQLPADARVLNQYEWGGYLMWNLPQLPLFIDGRTDIFVHEGVMQDYAQARSGEGASEVLDKYAIQYVLFPKQGPLVYTLAHDPHWKVSYEDANAMLFERLPLTAR